MTTVYRSYIGFVSFLYFGENELEAFKESEFANEMDNKLETWSVDTAEDFEGVMVFNYDEVYTGEESFIERFSAYMKDKGAIYLTSGCSEKDNSDRIKKFVGTSYEIFEKLDASVKRRIKQDIKFQEKYIEHLSYRYDNETKDDGISVIEW